MNISEAFNDIWPTHYLNYTDCPELINDPIDELISPELPKSSSLPLESLSSVSAANVENFCFNSSTSLINQNDSKENLQGTIEFSDSIDSYFYSYLQSHDTTEPDPQPMSHTNTVESPSTFITCYNSSFNSSFNSSTSFNLISSTDSIDLLNSKTNSQIVQVEPLLPLESLSTVSTADVENFSTDSSISLINSKENLQGIREFSDAIDSYFYSYTQSQHIIEPDPQPMNHVNSIQCSSTSLTCFNLTLNSSLDFPSTDLYTNSSSNGQMKSSRSSKVALLGKDCSKVKEPWIPSVAKKLLASYYSPLSIKSELFSNEIMLDAFEPVTLQEAVKAFSDIAFSNPYYDSELYKATELDFFSDPRPIDFVYSCEKLRAYRKLNTEDKMNLMARAFFDINTVKGAITYNETVDGWIIAGMVFPLKSISWESPNASIVLNLIETFPDCLRNDLNVITLIYLIIIFNPDLPKLKFRNGIRQEQYIYIYLLKRYLMSLFGSTCEASDYLYRLMVKIEQIIKLPETVVFEQIQSGSTKVLKNRILKLIQDKSITIGTHTVN